MCSCKSFAHTVVLRFVEPSGNVGSMSACHAFLLSAPEGPRDGTGRVAPQLLGAPEAEVIDRLRAGDERTYEQVYRIFRPRLVSIAADYVMGAVAEEIAQEVLALLWDRREEWPRERGIATYLYAAARNRARDHARHQGVVGRASAGSVLAEESLGTGERPAQPDELAEQAELGRAFVRAFGALPEGARSAFTLRWVHQLGYPEVAEILGVSEPAARKQVSRAREMLLSALSGYIG